MRRGTAAALGLLLVVASPAASRELWSSEETGWRLDFSGSARELFTVSQQTSLGPFTAAAAGCLGPTFPDCPAFSQVGDLTAVQSRTRLRMRLDLQAGESASAVLVYDQLTAAGNLRTLDAALGASFARESFWGAEQLAVNDKHVAWAQRLYRGYVTLERGPLYVRVGRQRIAWGEGRLWNPIDRLNAIGPLAIEPEESPGVDAIDVRWNFTGFNSLQLVYAPARDPDYARYAARWHGVSFDTDWSVLVGLFEQAPTVGFDLSRNVGDAAVRLEAVWADPEHEVFRFGDPGPIDPDSFWQVVVSLDANLPIGTGLYVLVEYLYNGAALGFGEGLAGPLLPLFQPPGVPASSDVFETSRVASGAKHLSGVQFGYDLTPELRADTVLLVDWVGGSAVVFPTLSWFPSGSLEFSLGVQVGMGPRRSEYGERGTLGYLRAEWFF